MNKINLSEIFDSIQGESTYAGEKCRFYRFTGCVLNCKYCDTMYRDENNIQMSINELVNDILNSNINLIQFTGGEPLLRKKEIINVARKIYPINNKKKFLIETSGAIKINQEDLLPNIIYVMDVKSPTTEMDGRMILSNLNNLRKIDQVKFVLSDDDIVWFKDFYMNYRNENPYPIWLISPMYKMIDLKKLSELVMESNNDLKMQVQLHKIIWDVNTRGV